MLPEIKGENNKIIIYIHGGIYCLRMDVLLYKKRSTRPYNDDQDCFIIKMIYRTNTYMNICFYALK